MEPRSPAGLRRKGYAVALLARTTSLTSRLAQELPLARAYACDAGDPATVERTFEAIESDLGSVDVLIYNAGKGVWGSAEEVTFEDFEAAWRTNTFGAFAAARSVIPATEAARRRAHYLRRRDRFAPRRRQDGNGICFGQGGSAAVWPNPSPVRSEPSKIHVSLIIIDGIVDSRPSIRRTKLADKLDSFFVQAGRHRGHSFLMLTSEAIGLDDFRASRARPFGEDVVKRLHKTMAHGFRAPQSLSSHARELSRRTTRRAIPDGAAIGIESVDGPKQQDKFFAGVAVLQGCKGARGVFLPCRAGKKR